jgi:hypothetical protein
MIQKMDTYVKFILNLSHRINSSNSVKYKLYYI